METTFETTIGPSFQPYLENENGQDLNSCVYQEGTVSYGKTKKVQKKKNEVQK